MNNGTCAIFFHNYYGQHEEWIRFFSEKRGLSFTLFYNIVKDSPYNISNTTSPDHLQKRMTGTGINKLIVRYSSNKGKDIGGKLVLLDACLREGINPDFCIFLHDKTSPYKVQGRQWRDKLFYILDITFIKKALDIFEKNKNTGIIAGSDNINNEYDFDLKGYRSNNRLIISDLQKKYNIFPKDYRYVAGTMFWCNFSPLKDFFYKYPPLDIRGTLENGNVMDDHAGTVTHSWERLLSWLIFTQGYTIKGL